MVRCDGFRYGKAGKVWLVRMRSVEVRQAWLGAVGSVKVCLGRYGKASLVEFGYGEFRQVIKKKGGESNDL